MNVPLRPLVRLLVETRLPYTDIAVELGLSVDVVRHYDRLVEQVEPFHPSRLLDLRESPLRQALSPRSARRSGAA
jgi:hypothetical protein